MAQANQLYESGQFAAAAAAYETLLGYGLAGADVYYNLGNAYARQRQLGRALAAYYAARRLAPRDPDVLANIRAVCALRANVAPQVPTSWAAAAAAAFVARYTLNELTAALLVLMAICAGLAVAILLRWGPVRRLAAALTCCALLLVVCAWATAVRVGRDSAGGPAFVCVSEATMRAGPGDNFEPSGTLTDGAEVQPRTEVGLWTEVTLPTGKTAWLRRSDLVRM